MLEVAIDKAEDLATAIRRADEEWQAEAVAGRLFGGR